MNAQKLLRKCLVLLVAAVCSSAAAAPPKPKIYIITDLEGASGVYKFSQTRPKDIVPPLGRQAMEYLMGDLAAVVRGLKDAGAGEIIALDGHGSQAFVPHLMEPGAKYITCQPGAHHASDPKDQPFLLWGLDETFAGLVWVGQHAMMGTPDGVLHHTQSSVSEKRYWYNGVESGELAKSAIYASYFGVPPILVAGDEAACREATQFFGKECVTVSVKKGLAREAAMLYPFAETRKALYEGAKRAIAAIPRCKPYRVKTPIHAKRQMLVFDGPEKKPRLVVAESTIEDVRKIFLF